MCTCRDARSNSLIVHIVELYLCCRLLLTVSSVVNIDLLLKSIRLYIMILTMVDSNSNTNSNICIT